MEFSIPWWQAKFSLFLRKCTNPIIFGIWDGIIPSWAAKRRMKELKIPYESRKVHFNSHASHNLVASKSMPCLWFLINTIFLVLNRGTCYCASLCFISKEDMNSLQIWRIWLKKLGLPRYLKWFMIYQKSVWMFRPYLEESLGKARGSLEGSRD